ERARVLVVDDDPDIGDLVTDLLEADGFHVRYESRPELALCHVRDWDPDLVILDYMLPGMTGVEILTSLRQDPSTTEVPVVMMSGSAGDMARFPALELGA